MSELNLIHNVRTDIITKVSSQTLKAVHHSLCWVYVWDNVRTEVWKEVERPVSFSILDFFYRHE